MVLDVLSERGYHVMSDMRTLAIPDRLDTQTGKIINLIKTEYHMIGVITYTHSPPYFVLL
jgi:hypothetical protein